MNIIQLYQDHDIHYAEEGNKHCTAGWVNIDCPLCPGSTDLHMGYNYVDDYFRCWRCGFSPKEKVIAALLHCTEWKAKQIIKQYHGRIDRPKIIKKKTLIGTKPFKMPNEEWSNLHRKYLINRNFNPELITQDWNVSGTGQNAFLDGIDYRHRLLIPIEFEGKVVSFQTRSLRKQSKIPYMACPIPREIHHHQHLLYGLDKVPDYRVVIAVEGVFDVWRLGFGTVAVFGIEYSVAQVRLLSKFDMVYVLFDNDPQAQIKGRELVGALRLKTNAENITQNFAQDPGAMSPTDAKTLKRRILK